VTKSGHFTQNPRLELVRQLDAVRVLALPFVFLGKNLFEPLCLSLRRFLIDESEVLKDGELLARNCHTETCPFP